MKGSDFKEVRHRAWRDFDELRRQATDAISGLGFGLGLAAAEVAGRVAHGDDTPLGEAFPELPAAADFSFRPDRAALELATAEKTLAQMTVPFAVTIYNEYVIEAVVLYDRAAPSGLAKQPSTMMLGELLAHLASAHHVSVGGYQGELIEILTHLRNRIVHYGGRAGSHLVDLTRRLSTDANEAWRRVAGHPFPVPSVGSVLALERRDAAAALATVDHAASELNGQMQTDFARTFWADLAVADYREQFPAPWRFDDLSRRKRALRGYAARDYAAAQLAEQDIDDAVDRAS